MNDPRKPDGRTLEQLYSQRKASHPAPESLKQTLLQHSPKRKAGQPWRYVLPALTASVATLFLIWPKQPVNMQSEMSDTLLTAAPEVLHDDAPMAEMAPPESPQSAPVPASRQATSAEPATVAKPAPVAKSAPSYSEERSNSNDSVAYGASVNSQPSAAERESLAMIAEETIAANEWQEEAISEQDLGIVADDRSPLGKGLFVVNGETGEFLDCLEQIVNLPISTDLTGWVKGIQDAEGNWTVVKTDSAYCPDRASE